MDNLPNSPNVYKINSLPTSNASRTIDVSTHMQNVTAVADRATRNEEYTLQQILPRMSNRQIMDILGTDEEETANKLREDPDTYFLYNKYAEQRINDAASKIANNEYEGDVDKDSNMFIDALGAVFGNTVGKVMEVIEIYDEYVADPVAGGVAYALTQMIGDDEVKANVDKKLSEGQNFWMALGDSFDEWGAPGWVKLGLQLGTDPMTYMGAIGLAKRGMLTGKSFVRLYDPGIELAVKGAKRIPDLPGPEEFAKNMGSLVNRGFNRVGKKILEVADPSRTTRADSLEGAFIIREGMISAGHNLSVVIGSRLSHLGSFQQHFQPLAPIVGSTQAMYLDSPVKTIWKGDRPHIHQKLTTKDITVRDIFDSPIEAGNIYGLSESQFEYVNEVKMIINDLTEKQRLEGFRNQGSGQFDFQPLTTKLLSENQAFTKGGTGKFNFNNLEQSLLNYVEEVYTDIADAALVKSPAFMGALTDASRSSLGRRAWEKTFEVPIDDLGTVSTTTEAGFASRKLGFGNDPLEFVDEKKAQAVEDALNADNVGGVLGKAADVANGLRTMKASTDFGSVFIQGLPLFFRSPKIWAKVAYDHIKSFQKSPARKAAYINQNADVAVEFIENGGIFGSADLFASLENNGWLARMDRNYAGHLLQRFGNSFDMFLDQGKLETYKAMRNTVLREQGPAGLADLAKYCNKMMGTIDTARMGVNKRQRAFEQAFAMFSPRYTRAMAALTLDAFKGGLAGREARNAMFSMMIGGYTTMQGFGNMFNQDINFNPEDGDFLKVEVGGVKVGIGGKMRTFARTAAGVLESLSESPNDFVSFRLFDADEYRKNPLLRFVRSNSSPLAGSSMNLFLGETGIGEQLPDEDNIEITPGGAKNLASAFGGELLPFALQGILATGSWAQKGGAFGAEFFGLSATTPRERDVLVDMKDKFSQEKHGRNYEELDKAEKFVIDQENETELEAQSLKATEQDSLFDYNRDRVDFFKSLNEFDDKWAIDVTAASDQFVKGIHGSKRGLQFRKMISNANQDRNTRQSDLKERYPDVVGKLRQGGNPDILFDQAYDAYMTQVFSHIDEYGELDYMAMDNNKINLKAEFGESTIKKVEQLIKDKKFARGDLDPVVIDYFQNLDTLKPYWEVWQSFPPREQILWGNLKMLNRAEQEAALEQRSSLGFELKAINRKIARERKNLRRNNPEIERFLVKFWDLKPIDG